MTRHVDLLDDLEARLRHPDFGRMVGGATGLSIERISRERMRIDASGKAPGLVIDVDPLGDSEGPDTSPRLALTSSFGDAKYADRGVDGLVMGVVSILLQARAGAM